MLNEKVVILTGAITANVLAPSMVEIDATKHISAEQKEQVEMLTPLGRIAKPEDIVRSVYFLQVIKVLLLQELMLLYQMA